MKLCTSCRESLQIAALLLCSVTVLCQKVVKGIEGQPITLPCSYKVKQTSDLTSMCWGRGSCPNSQCNEVLIWTDGTKITSRSSSRYQLNDNLQLGRVSLTIAQASLDDAGTYCCRIEHAGWFNDEKNNIKLTVVKEPPTTTVKTTTPAPSTVKTTSAPPTEKTTPAPPTEKSTPAPPTEKTTSSPPPPVQTTSEPYYIWTNPLTIYGEITTQPPPSVIKNTSPSPLPPRFRTDNPPSSTARTIAPSPNVFPAGTTEQTDLTPKSSDVPDFLPDYSAESNDKDQEHTTPSLWNERLSPNNHGNSDLFQGNVTEQLKKDKSALIIAISLSVIALIVISVILLQLKGQKGGHYLLGRNPDLELVTHAVELMTELEANAKDSDRAETNHTENMIDVKN
ncbi:uncharacterized protein LOC142750852 isoform X1 [Rhinoderma darwinii]|uniref:uncharacterized protein LOC142750852 isoform X1 n=1 Tax=Rhinoderma darwinii TaxID=43563 RepID=UPI003F67D0BB